MKELENHSITKVSLREDYVTTLGVMLLSFGRVGIWLYQNKEKKMKQYLKKLSEIDWSRNNKNWYGRIIRENGKIVNNENAVILAGNHIKKSIGIPLTKEEEKREENKII